MYYIRCIIHSKTFLHSEKEKLKSKRPEALISTCLFGANSYRFTLEWRESLCRDLRF